MKTFLKVIIIFLIFSLDSCRDPIFSTVFEETPILPPLIDGSPSNFVTLNNKLYVASGKQIWEYENNNWHKLEKLNGRVMCLAATTTSLYAIYLENDNNGKLKNCTSGEKISLSDVKSIYGVDNILFICVGENDNYTIYFIDENNPEIKSISIKKDNSDPLDSILIGVAYDTTYYYLCTYDGIFHIEKTQLGSSSATILGDVTDFTGIINLNDDYAAAITNDGYLYEISGEVLTKKANIDEKRNSTGALAVWKDGATPSLLLAGRREYYYSTTTGYSNGYVEITLDTTTGAIAGSGFKEPGKGSPTSIDNYDHYVSSLGKEPVNYIIQAPDGILFASTQQKGVWSYRDRGDGNGKTWNSEQ